MSPSRIILLVHVRFESWIVTRFEFDLVPLIYSPKLAPSILKPMSLVFDYIPNQTQLFFLFNKDFKNPKTLNILPIGCHPPGSFFFTFESRLQRRFLIVFCVAWSWVYFFLLDRGWGRGLKAVRKWYFDRGFKVVVDVGFDPEGVVLFVSVSVVWRRFWCEFSAEET